MSPLDQRLCVFNRIFKFCWVKDLVLQIALHVVAKMSFLLLVQLGLFLRVDCVKGDLLFVYFFLEVERVLDPHDLQ